METAFERSVNRWLVEHSVFDGTTLKLLAMAAMFMDHVAITLLARAYQMNGVSVSGLNLLDFWYRILRAFGRLAFPIFVFLLVEGMKHTSDERRYLTRLFFFALVSELPFDLALDGGLGLTHQNVFFTLTLGAVVIQLMKRRTSCEEQLAVVTTAAIFAQLCHFDYGAYGILLAAIFWWFYDNRIRGTVLGYLLFLLEPYSALGFVTILFYNGRRGVELRYFFYLFYPLHLFGLYFMWHNLM